MPKKISKIASVDKTADALFLTKAEAKTSTENMSLPLFKESISFKNKIFKYKDGTTTVVCYNGQDENYIVVNVN